ncbi:MAG: hypothetical protein ACOYXR_05745 [Nitrospirota bacterium]
MTRTAWKWIGPGLVVIVALFIVVSYLYDQKVHMQVISHMPDPPDVPGGGVYAGTLTDSDVGKAYLRVWEANTRRLNGPEYDLEIRLNDAAFFEALAAVEGKDARDTGARYQAYKDRYHFNQRVVFTVEMHSPKGRLFDVKPERQATLRLDSGEEYEPERWSDSNRFSEYRREGVLNFARHDGHPILASSTKTIELVWRDPATHEERRAVWELQQEP